MTAFDRYRIFCESIRFAELKVFCHIFNDRLFGRTIIRIRTIKRVNTVILLHFINIYCLL